MAGEPAEAGQVVADGTVACLSCEQPVLVNRDKWKEFGFSWAMCDQCFKESGGEQRLVQALMLIRFQMKDMAARVSLLESEVKSLKTRH